MLRIPAILSPLLNYNAMDFVGELSANNLAAPETASLSETTNVRVDKGVENTMTSRL